MWILSGALSGLITGLALWLTIRHERREARVAAVRDTAVRTLASLDELLDVYEDKRDPVSAAYSGPAPETQEWRDEFFDRWRRAHLDLRVFEAQLARDWPKISEVIGANRKALRSRTGGAGKNLPGEARHIVTSDCRVLQDWIVRWLKDPDLTNRRWLLRKWPWLARRVEQSRKDSSN